VPVLVEDADADEELAGWEIDLLDEADKLTTGLTLSTTPPPAAPGFSDGEVFALAAYWCPETSGVRTAEGLAVRYNGLDGRTRGSSDAGGLAANRACAAP
jgi:hypothetical protein